MKIKNYTHYTKPTRAYIRLPIFYCVLNFGRFSRDLILFGISSQTFEVGITKTEFRIILF